MIAVFVLQPTASGFINPKASDKAMNMTLLHLVFTLSLLLDGILAIGRAIVTNQCDAPIYLWSIGATIGKQVTLPRDSIYGEIFHSDPISGGIALRITSVPNGLTTPNASQLIFAYNIDDTSVLYDLSSLFGDGFAGRTLRIQPSDAACKSIEWYNGRTPAGNQAKRCQKEASLELTFCTGHCLPSWCK